MKSVKNNFKNNYISARLDKARKCIPTYKSHCISHFVYLRYIKGNKINRHLGTPTHTHRGHISTCTYSHTHRGHISTHSHSHTQRTYKHTHAHTYTLEHNHY